MVRCTCTYCNPPVVFNSKEKLKEHILKMHMDKVIEFLSKIPERKRSRIKHPEAYAAGYIATFSCKEEK